MNHQRIKISAYLIGLLLIILVFVWDIVDYSNSTKFERTLIAVPIGLIIIFLGSVYSNFFIRKNEIPQWLEILLKSCFVFFLIGSLWLISSIFFRGLLGSDFHFFDNQLLIENLKIYLFYTTIGFQIIAIAFALLLYIIKTSKN